MAGDAAACVECSAYCSVCGNYDLFLLIFFHDNLKITPVLFSAVDFNFSSCDICTVVSFSMKSVWIPELDSENF